MHAFSGCEFQDIMCHKFGTLVQLQLLQVIQEN